MAPRIQFTVECTEDASKVTLMKPTIAGIKALLIDLQSQICKTIEQEDGQATFITDRWQHPQGGGGITRVLREGAMMEQGGVNFSHVIGENLPPSATLQRPELTGCRFEALGISV